MSTVKTNAILDASGGNTATFNGIPLRQGVLDPDNRIINGAFDFWQRGTSSTASGYVAADRWVNAPSGGTVTQSRQAFTVGDTLGSNSPIYFLRQSVSGQTLSASFAITYQRIESVRSYAGQTITVLGWARRSSGTGNMVVEAEQIFGTGGSPSANVTSASVTVSLTGSWMPFAATISVPSIVGKTLGTNANDATQINFWTSGGSDYNSRTNSLGLQTIGVDLWGVHIKVGTHTTAATDLYKQPEMGPELVRCQRYFFKMSPTTSYGPYGMGHGVNATTFRVIIKTAQTMRAQPTLSFSAASSFLWSYGNALSAIVSAEFGVDAFSVQCTSTGIAANGGYLLTSNNNTTSSITADAEL